MSRRMPQDQTDSALMVQQINDRFRQGPDVLAYANELINFNLPDFSFEQIPGQAVIRNLPDFDNTIFTSGSDYVIIVRTPGDIQNGSFVASDQRMVRINSSDLKWPNKVVDIFRAVNM